MIATSKAIAILNSKVCSFIEQNYGTSVLTSEILSELDSKIHDVEFGAVFESMDMPLIRDIIKLRDSYGVWYGLENGKICVTKWIKL